MRNFQFSILNFKNSRRGFTPLEVRCQRHLPFRQWRSGLLTGFTLLEMLVSVTVFSLLVIAAVGITIQVMKAQTKAGNVQAVLDNIRFGLELMTREMRTGALFTNSVPFLGGCSGYVAGSEIGFIDLNLNPPEGRIYYLRSDNTIMRISYPVPPPIGTPNCEQAQPFSSEEVVIESIRFQLRGQTAGSSDGQPVITTSLTVRSRNPRFGTETRMNLQTTVVQRLRDL